MTSSEIFLFLYVSGKVLGLMLKSCKPLCLCVCVSERLVTEREILEERAERRLEIFKNLIDKMATAGPGPDTPAMVTRPLFLGSLNVMNAKNKKRLND